MRLQRSTWQGRTAGLVLAAVTALIAGACDVTSSLQPSGTPVGIGSPPPPPGGGWGALGGTVTINGEARPIAWVELQTGDYTAFATTYPSGSWEWSRIPAGNHYVIIKTPTGLTCDATRKPANVQRDQRTTVDFSCVGDLTGSIVGFASNEFGTHHLARVTLTGPVDRQTIANEDGFFAFEDLPAGEYLVWSCSNRMTVSVRDGATAYATVDCS